MRRVFGFLKFVCTWTGVLLGVSVLLRPVSFVRWQEQEAPAATLERRIRSAFDAFHHELGWQGAVLLTEGDEILLERAWGPVGANERFPINSISKSMTAGLILRLREQGLVSLHDPLCRFLDGPCPSTWDGLDLERILSHTSGLREKTSLQGLIFFLNDFTRALSPGEISSLAREIPRDPAGRAFAYSNFGYQLASLAIEHATKRPFARAMEEYLFRPAGLTETSVIEHGTKVRPGYAVWTTWRRGPFLRLPVSWYGMHKANSLGAGAVQSTLRDLARWGRLAMGDGFLSASSRELWLQPRKNNYALGWVAFEDAEGRQFYWHNGGSPGFHSQLFFIPESRTVLAVLSNVHGGDNDIDRGMKELHRLIAKQKYDLPVGWKWLPSIDLNNIF